MIFIEDLNFTMAAKGFLGLHMLDGGFGQFRDLLSWVCWKRGKYFATVDHKFTSQICPKCDTHTGKKGLKERQHICGECNYSTTRDHASAEVILNRGLEPIVPMDCRERKPPSEKSASPGETPGVYDGRCVLPGIAIFR